MQQCSVKTVNDPHMPVGRGVHLNCLSALLIYDLQQRTCIEYVILIGLEK